MHVLVSGRNIRVKETWLRTSVRLFTPFLDKGAVNAEEMAAKRIRCDASTQRYYWLFSHFPLLLKLMRAFPDRALVTRL